MKEKQQRFFPHHLSIENISNASQMKIDKLGKRFNQITWDDKDERAKELARLLLRDLKEYQSELPMHFPGTKCDDPIFVYLKKTIRALEEGFAIQEHLDRELEDIKRGLYQHQLYAFTYEIPACPDFSLSRLNQMPSSKLVGHKTIARDRSEYHLFPLMDQPGLRCIAAILQQPSEGPIEIQINFFGTIDFASELVDMEEGGPGQQTLKKQELRLLRNIDKLVERMKINHPDKEVTLRLSGHSLGGSLAKGMAHTIQRACAVHKAEPGHIIAEIKNNLVADGLENNEACVSVPLNDLKKKLQIDKERFKGLNALSHLAGVTVYALGAPGVSRETDHHAALLTYYHEPDFLKVYHHYHQEDITVKFGDTEFLSGKAGIVPRISINKVIQYQVRVTDAEVSRYNPLPFPGLTSRVMAMHNKQIYNIDSPVVSEVTTLNESKGTSEKFIFSPWRRGLYQAAFLFKQFIAFFDLMRSLFPKLNSFPADDAVSLDTLEMKL